jgi:hypothetical protein
MVGKAAARRNIGVTTEAGEDTEKKIHHRDGEERVSFARRNIASHCLTASPVNLPFFVLCGESSGERDVSRRKRLYVIGTASAVLVISIVVGGYLYLIWLARVVERITD